MSMCWASPKCGKALSLSSTSGFTDLLCIASSSFDHATTTEDKHCNLHLTDKQTRWKSLFKHVLGINKSETRSQGVFFSSAVWLFTQLHALQRQACPGLYNLQILLDHLISSVSNQIKNNRLSFIDRETRPKLLITEDPMVIKIKV